MDDFIKVAAVVGPLVGIVIGWYLTQRTTRENAQVAFANSTKLTEQTLEGQRRQAADTAKRERRKNLVDPFLARTHARINQYGELMDALARHDFDRCLALFDLLGKSHETSANLMDMFAPGDLHIRQAGATSFSAETDCWNMMVTAFNDPASASNVPVGDAFGSMWIAYGQLVKAADDFVTRIDTGNEIDFREKPEAAPQIPMQTVRFAPRRDAAHPWYGQPPLTSTRGDSGSS